MSKKKSETESAVVASTLASRDSRQGEAFSISVERNTDQSFTFTNAEGTEILIPDRAALKSVIRAAQKLLDLTERD